MNKIILIMRLLEYLGLNNFNNLLTVNQRVVGSSPTGGAKTERDEVSLSLFFIFFIKIFSKFAT